MLNIGGDGSDKSYRYKMPRLLVKVEGRGNGIKTAIPNMVDIAKALHTPPAYPTKFFGIELGAQSKFNKKTERAIVNGAHTNKDMQELLGKFINLFILCPTCGLPELNMAVKKGTIKLDCAACGHNGDISHQHKLATYIVKNPPGKKKEKAGKGKKGKKGKKGSAQKEEEEEAPAEAEQAVAEVEASAEWFTDTSKAAQQARKAAEFSEMKADADIEAIEEILAKAKLENKAESPVTMLKIFFARGKSTVPEVTSEVRRLQLARGLDDSQKVKVLLEALLETDNLKNAHKDLAARADVLQTYCTDKGSTLIFVSCIEELVGVTFTDLLKRTPLILQALYEADVLDEDAIINWADSPPESSYMVNKEVAVAVRHHAAPFIQWLKEADSEDEEE